MWRLPVLLPVVTCSSLRQSIDTDASAFITESTENGAFSLARDGCFRCFSCVHHYHTSRFEDGGKGTFKTIISNNLGKNVKYYHMKN